MRALHRINPLRIEWLRDRIAAHFPGADGAPRDTSTGDSLSGLRLLDLGCGAGILSEPLCRLGGTVVAVDASEPNIAIARERSRESGLPIDYRCASGESVLAAGERFDVVFAMELIEHVPSPRRLVETLCGLTRPGGMVFVSTLNRTLKSFALAIVAAEYVLRWVPRGTHQWDKFVTPDELARAFEACGYEVAAETGIVFDPVRRLWRLSGDRDVNFMAAAIARA
jgi:2-polyprenyl-6-hydroxyphenyl methylase/3-demethylubiquinone-9 3-methyltransferase